MPVNPWAGYYQGLASLDKSLDSMDASRIREEELARKTKRDSLEEQVIQGKMEDEGRKRQEQMAYRQGLAGLEAEDIPAPQKADRQIQLAIQHGQTSAAKDLSSVRSDEQKRAMEITKVIADTYKATNFDWDKTSALLKIQAQKMGIDPAQVDALKPAQGQGGNPIVMFQIGDTGSTGVIDPATGRMHVIQPKQKTLTEAELYFAAANGDPTAQRAIAMKKERGGGAGGEVRIGVNTLTPEENSAVTRAIGENRLNPNKVNSRTAKIYAQMEMENPGMSFAGKAADIEADSKSLYNQQKIRDMMASFVINMNKQVDRLEEISGDIRRTDVRLMNVPIRRLAMTVKGSAIESKVGMYLTEISNEIGKLSTGSAASIAELTKGAQEKWEKIHDPNLSLRDLMSLLKETKHAGNMRIQSVDEVIGTTKGRLKGKGVEPASDSGKLTLDEAKEYVRKAGGDKDKAREMAKKDGRSF